MDRLWHYFLCLNITSGFNSALSFAWYIQCWYAAFRQCFSGHFEENSWKEKELD